MTIRIEAERVEDRTGVAEVVARAFGRADEALLVEALRNAGDLHLSLVARQGSDLVGHIAFQPVRVEGAARPIVAASLAPVSVVPGRQRQGIGAALVRAGLDRLRQGGTDIVFVLGDPAYYGRFGFSAAAAAGYDAPWPAPYFQALDLSADVARSGRLVYPAAFFEGTG